MYVTKEKLQKLGACESGMSLFLQTFPSGRVSLKKLLKLLKEQPLTYHEKSCRGWFGAMYPGLTKEERISLMDYTRNGGRCIYDWCGCSARNNLDLSFEERCEFLRICRSPRYWTRGAADLIPGLTDEQKEILRNWPEDS